MMEKFFNAESIAIVGASKNIRKVGAVILNNLLKNGYSGRIYPVNPKYKEIYGLKCYKSILEIKERVDLVIVAVPSKISIKVMKEAGKKGIKNAIVISGGFGESGEKELERELKNVVRKYKINMIGPNCIGILSNKHRIDTVFFPLHKLKRPGYGNVSIVSQSGGVGIILISMAAEAGIGINKFISYGNAYQLEESDFIRYLADDVETKTILLYIEGIKNGKKFMDALSYANKKKPVIVLKAGKTDLAKKAAKTHTGALAGNYAAYKAVFRKSKVVEVNNMKQLFDLLTIFDQPPPRGKKIGIITNGGGLGVMAVDEMAKRKMELAKISENTKEKLRSFLPYYATPDNPLDLIADADVERYRKALETFMRSEEVDMVLINILFQSPVIDETILNYITECSKSDRKPIAVVVPGGGVAKHLREILNINGVPAFANPEDAVFALKALYEYSRFREKLVEENSKN